MAGGVHDQRDSRLHHSHLDVGYTHSQPFVWELQQEYLTTGDRVAGVRPVMVQTLARTRDGHASDHPVLRWIDRSPAPLVDRFIALCRSDESADRLGASRHGARRSPGLRRLIEGKTRLKN